jgi:hypothetical protein
VIIETLTHLALALTHWAWFALIWRSLLHIAHADEQTWADAPQQCSVSGGERVVDPGPQGGQGDGAGLPGGHLPAAQYQQGRDGLGPEPL